MIQKVYTFIRSLGAAGCRPEYPASFLRNIQLTNYSVFIASFSVLLFNIINYTAGSRDIIQSLTVILTFVPSFWLGLYLNFRHRHYFAAVIVNILITASVFNQLIILNQGIPGLKYYFFLFSIIPLITIPLSYRGTIILLSLMNISAYLLSSWKEMADPPVYPYNQNTVLILYGVSVTGVFITVLIITAFNQFFFSRAENRLEVEAETHRKTADSLRQAHEEQTSLSAELSELSRQLMQKNEILKNLAIRDGLTGLYNRYYFDEMLHDAAERTSRYGEPISLILLDIDHFKTINDTYGHDTGDLILTDVARIIKESVRKADICARWGGEEFIILMPQTSSSGSFTAAEKIRLNIEKHEFAKNVKVTASLGTAEKKSGETTEDWFSRTDKALYLSKNSGRNRTSEVRL